MHLFACYAPLYLQSPSRACQLRPAADRRTWQLQLLGNEGFMCLRSSSLACHTHLANLRNKGFLCLRGPSHTHLATERPGPRTGGRHLEGQFYMCDAWPPPFLFHFSANDPIASKYMLSTRDILFYCLQSTLSVHDIQRLMCLPTA